MEYSNLYLIRKLEESSQYYNKSFSNRYMNWKRCSSISKSLQQELKRLGQKDKPIRILDVGCGDGWIIYALKSELDKKYRLEFTGIDISGLDIEFAQQKKGYFQHKDCNFQIMDAQNLEFGEQEFDIVISSELIEHILQPHKVAQQVYRVLKRDGLFILTTPNKSGGLQVRLFGLIKGIVRRRKVKPGSDFIEEKGVSKIELASDQGITGAGLGHVSVKSQKEWLEIFKKEGFRILSVKGTSGLLFGSPSLDNHRILFALALILDVLLEKLLFSYLWSESLLFELRKC